MFRRNRGWIHDEAWEPAPLKGSDPTVGGKPTQIHALYQLLGPALFWAAVVLIVTGFLSLVGSLSHARVVGSVFMGLAIAGLVIVLTNLGFWGSSTRDASRKAKDPVGEMVEGIRKGVEVVARVVGQGLLAAGTAIRGSVAQMMKGCAGCGAQNPDGANYCNQCGTPLGPHPCKKCGSNNPPDAQYCNKCGRPIES